MKRLPALFSPRVLPVLAALSFGLLLGTAFTPAAQAQNAPPADQPDAVVEVDGLACPFCAYGLEKKLKKLDGVADLNVQIDGGRVELDFAEGQRVAENAIREAVSDAGFTVRGLTHADAQAGDAQTAGGSGSR